MYHQIDANKTKTALLISLFLLVIIGLGWLLSYVYNSPAILIAAVIFSLTQALISYYYSDRIALASSSAEPVTKSQEPELVRTVENLAITAGVPAPKVYVLPSNAINAFATGRDPDHASIAVTRGALDKLNRTELEGVLAHEMSHVTNYDIRLATIVVVLVGIVALASDWFLRSLWWGGGRRGRDNDGGNALVLVGIVLAILAPLSATLIQLAVSRKREFLADASGALLTRYPEGLADALEKIKGDQAPLEIANKATAHLYFSDPFKKIGEQVGGLLSTHPPIDERISALRAMD